MAFTDVPDTLGKGLKSIQGAQGSATLRAILDEGQAYDTLVAAATHPVDDYTTDVITSTDTSDDPLYIDPGTPEETYTVDAYAVDTATITDEVQDGHSAIYAAPVDGCICRLECAFKGAAQVGPQALTGGDNLIVTYAAAPAGVVCLVTKTGIWAPHISLKDMYVRTGDGNLIAIQYDVDAATNQGAFPVWGDDDGAACKLISDNTNTALGAGNGTLTSETAVNGIAPSSVLTRVTTGGGDGIVLGTLNGWLTGTADAAIDIGDGVMVPIKHRTASGYAVVMNATLDGLECNNTGTETDLYFLDSNGDMYKVTHNAACGAVGFTAEAAGPPTTFSNTGGGVITSETGQHSLAPKTVLTTPGHPAIP